MIPLLYLKLYFEDFDYSSLICHLLRTFVCDLCLIWWCWVTYINSLFYNRVASAGRLKIGTVHPSTTWCQI